jgi:hypothetical protein
MATVYPLRIIQMDCSPLVIDNGYEVVEQSVLVQWVAQLLLGNSLHISRVIEGLDSKAVNLKDKAIDSIINRLKTCGVYKRDGWLFQMISWIALKIYLHTEYGSGNVFMNAPHTAPAQHGIDGFSLVINDKKQIKYIVLCEDKCSEEARAIITNQVFPEFEEYEDRKYDNRVLAEVSSIIRGEDGGGLLQDIQEDIVNNKYWMYRIGVTRQEEHDVKDGREKLYKDYDKKVTGDVGRRDAASVNLHDVRKWMETFSQLVIKELESKKSKDV